TWRACWRRRSPCSGTSPRSRSGLSGGARAPPRAPAGAPSGMLPYIGRRLLATLPVMTVVAVVVFMLLRLTTGDPAALIAGDNARAEEHASEPHSRVPLV